MSHHCTSNKAIIITIAKCKRAISTTKNIYIHLLQQLAGEKNADKASNHPQEMELLIARNNTRMHIRMTRYLSRLEMASSVVGLETRLELVLEGQAWNRKMMVDLIYFY